MVLCDLDAGVEYTPRGKALDAFAGFPEFVSPPSPDRGATIT